MESKHTPLFPGRDAAVTLNDSLTAMTNAKFYLLSGQLSPFPEWVFCCGPVTARWNPLTVRWERCEDVPAEAVEISPDAARSKLESWTPAWAKRLGEE